MKQSYRLLAVLLVILISLGLPGTAHAQGIIYGDIIPAGVTVDHDVVLVGQNVLLAGTVNGNVFILGNQVNVTGTIDGSLILLGQNTVVAGKVSGAVYAAALTLELGPAAALGRDLYIGTVSLTSQPGSQVGRDLFALSLDAGLNGKIGRDPHTVIGPIQLYNGLMQMLGFNEFMLKLHIDFPNAPAGQGSGPMDLAAAPLRHLRARSMEAMAKAFDWTAWGINQLRDWVVISIFGLIAFAWMRGRLRTGAGPVREKPWGALGIGLVALVIAASLFVVGLLLAALIFSIGLGLNFIGLWQLSIALWIASYSCLLLAAVALWFFIVYGTKIVVAAACANWLNEKLKAPAAWVEALLLVAALLAYVLLRSVPYIGWVFGVLFTAGGMGSAWLAYRAARQPKPVEMPASAPALQPMAAEPAPVQAVPGNGSAAVAKPKRAARGG